MTDLIKPSPPDQGLTVEERLALLEAKLNPSPLALVPPITVGSLSNVPAPGSQLAAQWAQDASSMVVHRFASRASLDGWAAPVGALGVTTDDGVLFRRRPTYWSRVSPPYTASAFYPAVAAYPGGGVWSRVLSLTIPADPAPRLVDALWHVRGNFFEPYGNYVSLVIDGVNVAQSNVPPVIADTSGYARQWTLDPQVIGYQIPANKPIVVEGQYLRSGPGSDTPFTDVNVAAYHKLSVSVVGV